MNIQKQTHIPVQLANAWFAKGKLAQAASFYQQAIQIDANCSVAYFGLGRIALYMGQSVSALGHFEQALQLDPDNYRLQIFCDALHEQQLYTEVRQSPKPGSRRPITQKPAQVPPKLCLNKELLLGHHRSGWQLALQALRPLHCTDGVLFDGALEHNFLFRQPSADARPVALIEEMKRQGTFAQWATAEELGLLPYQTPWVGVIHHTPNMPATLDHYAQCSLQKLLVQPAWQASLAHCVGLFTLSEYNARWLRAQTGLPVSVVIHPTEIPAVQFDFARFQQNQAKKIVQIGWWLRRLNAIYQLPLAQGNALNYTKIWLTPQYNLHTIHGLLRRERQLASQDDAKITDDAFQDNTQALGFIPNDQYDELLAENLVFVDLYDSSANNTVIECIARATPLLINPLPAVVEYLGADYPLYFDSLTEAAQKALDLKLIADAHHYLKQCPTRAKLDGQYFLDSIVNSEVYQLIA